MHTPGPWRVHGVSCVTTSSNQRIEILAYTPNPDYLGDCERWGIPDARHVAADNTRLMAAAPELLAALQAIVSDCREVLESREVMSMDLIHAIANGKAKSAIAKALGK